MFWRHAPNPWRKAAGFTLVELVIAAMITSFLGGVVYLAFAQGLRVWRRAALDRPTDDVELALEHVTRDLRSAMPSKRAPFVGRPTRMEFEALLSPGGEESAGTALPGRVSYAFDAKGKALQVTRQSLREILANRPAKPLARPVARLVRCAMEYYDAPRQDERGGWKNSWQAPCPPHAVKVSVDVEASSGRVRKVTKLIGIPAGGCPAAQASP